MNDFDHIAGVEAEAAHGHYFRVNQVPTPLDEIMAKEEGDADSEERMRQRQQDFRRLVMFLVDGTFMKPNAVAMRVLTITKACFPDLLQNECETGGADVSLGKIGEALGRTRAAMSAQGIRLQEFINAQLGGHSQFVFQRRESTRVANARAAIGNNAKRTGMARKAQERAAGATGAPDAEDAANGQEMANAGSGDFEPLI